MTLAQRARRLLIALLLTVCVSEAAVRSVRAKRQTNGGGNTSILTVQWEGIQSKTDDGVIKGFRVEYRPEHDGTWIEHEGLIPYRGPFFQYKVTIRDLPSGMTYYVRIKVIGQNDQVLVSTGEIRAETQTVGIDCTGDSISVPVQLQPVSVTQHALTFKWEAPECGGSNVHFEVLLSGHDQFAAFDLHRTQVNDPKATVGQPGGLISNWSRIFVPGQRGCRFGWAHRIHRQHHMCEVTYSILLFHKHGTQRRQMSLNNS